MGKSLEEVIKSYNYQKTESNPLKNEKSKTKKTNHPTGSRF